MSEEKTNVKPSGIDIEGWSCFKDKRQNLIKDMVDRSFITRSTFPLIIKSTFDHIEGKNISLDFVYSILEQKSIEKIDFLLLGKEIFIFDINRSCLSGITCPGQVKIQIVREVNWDQYKNKLLI